MNNKLEHLIKSCAKEATAQNEHLIAANLHTLLALSSLDQEIIRKFTWESTITVSDLIAKAIRKDIEEF